MKPVTFLAALLALAACDTQVETRKDVVPAAEQAATPAPAAASLTAAGPAATLQPETAPDVQQAAAVVQLDELKAQGQLTAKLFGTGGGDPAMNGLYTHLAFFQGPAEGWRVFRLGDVLEYRVLSEARGRVDLEIEESVMDEAAGSIGSRTRRVIVGWAVAADGSAPPTVTVTPAQ
ncbi:hypothetical protein [Brevundimonas sp. Root1423]|uniref:hypothetical protein n=1 Tax=Brevundimonas sp. Root1423 TaxID=1736462 RepID=UPI0006FD6E06|nr:hypothetical protein [Brevundimonas sp. Root1423]KQY75122.1 hypothetical protein ASD25_11070 [Brevundimonas sp. Root1423]